MKTKKRKTGTKVKKATVTRRKKATPTKKSRKSLFGKTVSRKKKAKTRKKPVHRLNGTKRTPSRKALLDELVSIEKEGQIYEKIVRDARLKKQPDILKIAKDALKRLGVRQHEIFDILGY